MYMINKESIKGEEDEQTFSGSRIRHYWFADYIILFWGFLSLQKSQAIEGVETDTYLLVSVYKEFWWWLIIIHN